MKKITLLCIMLMAVATTAFAQRKKVAVVTFYADKQVGLSDVGLDGVSMVTNLMNDPNFNLQPLIEQYHDKFFGEYAKKFPFDLADEVAVTTDPDYVAYQPTYRAGDNEGRYVVAPGYKPIDQNFGKSNEQAMLKAFPEMDGVMFVYINFELQKGFGVGGTATTKMRVTTVLNLYNKKGDKVFGIVEGENSKKTGVMVGGVPVMKPEKLLPMCESALNELMGDLEKRLTKIIDKSAKKL